MDRAADGRLLARPLRLARRQPAALQILHSLPWIPGPLQRSRRARGRGPGGGPRMKSYPPEAFAAMQRSAAHINKTEQAYRDRLAALKLERTRVGGVLDFAFEAVKLRIGEKCWYTPDFM